MTPAPDDQTGLIADILTLDPAAVDLDAVADILTHDGLHITADPDPGVIDAILTCAPHLTTQEQP